MRVSMNGARIQATRNVNDLKEAIDDILESFPGPYPADVEELKEAFNRVGQSVGIFNCMYDDENEDDFDDLSEQLEIDFFELD